MNYMNPLLAGLRCIYFYENQVFKINIAMDDRKVHQALYQASQKEETDIKPKTQEELIIPPQPSEAMMKTEDLYKLQALTQQEIIKRQLIENFLLRQQQESVMQILKGSNVKQEQDEEQRADKGSQKKIKKVNSCGHPDKEHYAKGMCNNCYHRYGRTKKPWNCEHEKLYACGLCQNCYINKYNKKRRLESGAELPQE